eukprot:GEMP01021563.1.p1 GENE.GEMP01021563.1~~GEMP01021563.1.p1  ORF type:complete len:404 (+),score=78.95 GEMP01021563.1:62-1273(+)
MVGASQKSGQWLPNVELKQQTELVHACIKPDEKSGAILTPLYLSTTFIQDSIGDYLAKGYSYSRTNNPTVKTLEDKVALIERGFGAACVSTGMAATTTVIAGLMKSGEHCVITDCSYGGTNRICREQFIPLGMEFSFVDFRDVSIIEKAIIPGKTKIIFSETPANPTLGLVDLEAVSGLAKKYNCLHVVDSTFATPIILRPMDHGADIVIQSLTKFYDGHNVSVGGAVIVRTQELYDRVKLTQNMHGNIMAPQVAFHILQTMKTMGLRVRQQSATALNIAQFLEKHPKVTKVIYPGLASFPQKAIADKYHRDNLHGAMLWFDVEGGSEAGTKLMDTIARPWSLCENLGATESIITACAIMTHANMLSEDRLKVGITDGFIRVSCGIEDVDDLKSALKAALDAL